MPIYHLRKKCSNLRILEIVYENDVVEEIYFPFDIGKRSTLFSSVEEVHSFLTDVQMVKAKNYAFRLLSLRAYSSHSLQQKMKQKGFFEPVIANVLQYVLKEGYVTDEDLARSLIVKKLQAGFGPFVIERFLEEKGLESFFKTYKFSKADLLKAMSKCLPRLRGKSIPQQMSFLYRKGFSKDMIFGFLKEKIED